MLFWGEFTLRLKRAGEAEKNPVYAGLRQEKTFKWLSIALWTSTILIFLRCVYRVVELQGGYDGPIANDEISFMILEGVLIILAATLLTIMHPGRVLRGGWLTAAWHFRQKNATGREKVEGA